MTDAASVLADPRWLPHAIDRQTGDISFLRIAREDLLASGFLAELDASDRPVAALSRSAALAANLPARPLHFVFHTAFCRSTLLVRALNIPGTVTGLAEPGVIGSLVNGGTAVTEFVRPVLDMLSRPFAPGETIFVKPTNHANMLIPALLDARPDAKAVLMTNALAPFLRSVLRKGMMGRRWGRLLFVELQSYAGMDFGMDAREQFAMTDLQTAALAWFLNQRWFATLVARYGERLRVLDGDRFDAERAATLRAIGDFTGTAITRDQAETIAAGPVFARHAKLGVAFADRETEDAERSESSVNTEEIAQVGEWIGLIADQAGLTVPLEQTLF